MENAESSTLGFDSLVKFSQIFCDDTGQTKNFLEILEKLVLLELTSNWQTLKEE